jgi:hypothetical protein
MPKKVVLKTSKNELSPQSYFDGLDSEQARMDAQALDVFFRKASGLEPKMWGSSIVGYGEYIYYRANGDEGLMMATGFSIRKSGPVLYIITGYDKAAALLEKLGPHKLGKSCLYIKRLSDVDLNVVEALIKDGLLDLKSRYTVDY